MTGESIWNENKVNAFIVDAIEEHTRLEYKGPGALQKTDGKKKELIKDVTSMANASGGIIIYGIEEFSEKDKAHLPKKISPLQRGYISREWLDQVISSINPPIKDYLIHPVKIGSNQDDVIYILEIPQSTTAHQARDGRYYRRRNTTTQILEHYEIIDILNRRILPDVSVEFDYKTVAPITGDLHVYDLIIKIINSGPLVEHYQLDFTFRFLNQFSYNDQLTEIGYDPKHGKVYIQRVVINSENVLFPQQVIDFSKKHRIRYSVDSNIYWSYKKNSSIISWVLYADQMTAKTGEVEFQSLNKF